MSEKRAEGDGAPSSWESLWKQATQSWQQAMEQATAGKWPADAPWADPVEQWRHWTGLWWQGMGQGSAWPGAAPGEASGAAQGTASGAAAGHVAPDPSAVLSAALGPMGAGMELYGELGRFWLRMVMDSAHKGPQAWQEGFSQERIGELQRLWSRHLGRLTDGVALYPLGPVLSGWLGGVTQLTDLGGQLGVRLLGPWGESLRELLAQWQKAVQGDPESFRRFVKTWKETYDKTHGRLLQAPLLGYSREPAERLTRSLDAFVDYLATVQEFMAVLDRVGKTAIGRFSGRATELGADGTIPGHKRLYRLFIDTFEESFLDVFRSREYSRLQSQMVNAGLRFKKRLDETLEDLFAGLPIPTDGEMRELYSAFYELRKTVKTQRRQIAALEARLATLEGSGSVPRGQTPMAAEREP